MFNLSSAWKKLCHLTLSELVAVFGDKIPEPPVSSSYLDRIFNQEKTFWLFLSQVLSATQSCRETLKKAQMWHSLSDKKKHLFQYICLLSGKNPAGSRIP